ncbi:MAG: cupredoxin domain-containing protein [Chloroflexota bacterium]|nr:cupredoxin domain-containing protein [Chloroflexota bacterium]
MTVITHPLFSLRRIALTGILAGTMLAGLAACGDTAATAVPATSAATATAPADMSMGTMALTSDVAPTSAAATAATTGGGATNAAEVQATLKEWALDLNQTSVAAGAVRFVVNNTGKFSHNFTIKDASGAELGHTSTFAAAAGPQTLEVTLKPGTYTVYCSLPGHADRGQKNTLTVK